MTKINDILDSFTKHHPDGDTTIIKRAYLFGSRKHEGQTRKSGEPYMMHPISVAKIVADMGLCEPSICAALLHDTIEDTDTTKHDLTELFGANISEMVDGLTKLSKVHFTHREEQQAESFRKMLVATTHDIRVLLVKLADRLHNMSTLEHLADTKRERIAQETRDIYAPLANRLGISWLKAELEDMSFKYLETEQFNALSARVAKSKKARQAYIDSTISEIESFLKESNFEVTVTGRFKNLFSTQRKMNAKGIPYEKVHDAIAFRVLCDTVSDCYAILGLIHSKWVPVPGRIKDYIAMPKPNHYSSLHTTVLGKDGEQVEIQIRTTQMHRINEFGIAAHWAYKEGKHTQSENVFSWLRNFLDNQDGVKDSREFLDSVKMDLFPNEVFVFTPAGDVKSLRSGATPLDFAYAIHTEVGNRCVGARVNSVQVPFNTVLKNGDQVEITTSKNQRPSSAWLNIVASSRAKNKIRHFLRAEQREKSLHIGQNILEKGLRKFGCSFNRMLKAGEVKRVSESFKLHAADDLLVALGYGKLELTDVLERLLPEDKRNDLPATVKETTFEKVIRKVKRQDSGIILDGVDNLLVKFARCCNPLPGEAVIGYISRGRGIIVHNRNCSKASALDPERQTKVQWSNKAVSQRPVQVKVITSNRAGLLADISATFLSKDINISSAHCESDGVDRATNIFTFLVKNLDQLNDLIRSLKKHKGVYSIRRMNS